MPQLCLNPESTPVPIWKSLSHAQRSSCPIGWQCPNLNATDSATYISYCPPTDSCQIARLKGSVCDSQGLYNPVFCSAGSYCPQSAPHLTLPCPAGYRCPAGTSSPYPCSGVSYCPQGSSRELYTGSILITGLFDLLLLLLVILWKNYERRRAAAVKQIWAAETPKNGREVVFSSAKGAESAQKSGLLSATALEELCRGFEREREAGRSPLLDFQFNNLGLQLPGGKKILQGVTGRIESGKVTAIMGPSGQLNHRNF
jgi:hypothetical protein